MLTEEWTQEQAKKLEARGGAAKAVQRAVCRSGVEAVAERPDVVARHADGAFSCALDATWAVANQRQTGRCWLFAGLNTLRAASLPQLRVGDVEFSQAHLFFWSKMERCNYLLAAVADLSGAQDGDRTLDWILEHPVDDGGQYDIFRQLVERHGVVPKTVMPETAACERSYAMNSALAAVLRDAACAMRTASSAEGATAARRIGLEKCFVVLTTHLGTPPERFSWQWSESDKHGGKKGTVRRVTDITPLEFARDVALGGAANFEARLTDLVSLVNDPRNPYMRSYTVDRLGSVVGAPEVRYLNVQVGVLKETALRMLQAGMPVWFGCDAGKGRDKKEGIWDDELYDEASVYGGFRPGEGLSKAARLVYHETLMTHAMMFTGVDVVEGKPRKWRIENSWGKSVGKDGIFSCSDSWLDEHLFEISAPRSMLTKEMVEALALDPVVLPAWDPMGSLAFWRDQKSRDLSSLKGKKKQEEKGEELKRGKIQMETTSDRPQRRKSSGKKRRSRHSSSSRRRVRPRGFWAKVTRSRAFRFLCAPCIRLNASIRASTITLFTALILLGMVIFGMELSVLSYDFQDHDVREIRERARRVAEQISVDAADLGGYLEHYTYWSDCADAVLSLQAAHAAGQATSDVWDAWWADNFLTQGEWNTERGLNLVAVYDANWTHLFSEFHPLDTSAGVQCNVTAGTVPAWFLDGKNVATLGDGFAGLLTATNDTGVMLVAVKPVLSNNGPSTPGPSGHMLWVVVLRGLLQSLSERAPTCITAWQFHDGHDTSDPMPEEAREALASIQPAVLDENGVWTGTLVLGVENTGVLETQAGRLCSTQNKFLTNSSRSSTAYMLLWDGFEGHPAGPFIRVDRPWVYYQVSKYPIITGIMISVVLLVISGIICIAYIDLMVLRRVERLGKAVIESTTAMSAPEALEMAPLGAATSAAAAAASTSAGTIDSPQAVASSSKHVTMAPPPITTDEHYFSSSDTESDKDGTESTRSGGTFSLASTTASTTTDKDQPNRANEIEALRNIVRSNIRAVREKVAEVSAELREEGRRRVRHRDALHLLNLWCGRAVAGALPGLRATAATDPRTPHGYTLDQMLSSPLAVEFLKAHCRSESSLENVLFILDLTWLHELEQAEDGEPLPSAKKPLHDAAAAAAQSIIKRYFAPGAQMELNISGANKKRFAKGGDTPYTRGMFADAEKEIKYTLNSDVLQRFRQTDAFTALCEILDIEAGSKVRPDAGTVDDDRRPSDAIGLEGAAGDGTTTTMAAVPSSTDAIASAFSHTFKRLRYRSLASPATAPSMTPTMSPLSPSQL